MKISKKSLGKQHSLISVELIEKDYSEKVNDILVNYSKTANMPGFRKGHIPLGLVKKQYGKAVIVDEVNKIIQEELRKYLVAEKLDIKEISREKHEADEKNQFGYSFVELEKK